MKRLYVLAILIISLLNQVGAMETRDSVMLRPRNVMSSLLVIPSVYTTSRNYVVETIYLDPTTSVSNARTVIKVTYLDGFGRPLQEIQVGGTPGGTGDIIQRHVYGVSGRVELEYLPYNKTGNNGAFDSNATNTSNWNIYGTGEAPYAFTRTDYDNSPLDRVVK